MSERPQTRYETMVTGIMGGILAKAVFEAGGEMRVSFTEASRYVLSVTHDVASDELVIRARDRFAEDKR